ncbi:MAG TPA: hypothetical protein VE398_12215 [Acidobacteriota bacterium]|nr:hypothetical protein [Acidobacteriota bacterium]
MRQASADIQCLSPFFLLRNPQSAIFEADSRTHDVVQRKVVLLNREGDPSFGGIRPLPQEHFQIVVAGHERTERERGEVGNHTTVVRCRQFMDGFAQDCSLPDRDGTGLNEPDSNIRSFVASTSNGVSTH